MNETNNRRSVVSKVILVTVSLALLAGLAANFTPLFGASTQTAKTQDKEAFQVNGRPVMQQELDQIKASSQIFNLKPGGIAEQEIDLLPVRQAILIAAAKNDAGRIKISNDEVKKFIDDFRQRSGTAGDDAKYASQIASQGYTDTTFRQAVREQLAIQKRVEEVQKNAKVSDEQMRWYFDLNSANYKNEARVKARQIVLTDQKKADSVLSKANNGEDFAKLARENSTDKAGAAQDGAIGAKGQEKVPQPVTRVVFPTAVAEEVFKLKAGETSKVISDNGKFYIVKVEAVLPEGSQTFDQAKDKLKTDTEQIAKNDAVNRWIEDLLSKAKVTFPKNSTISYYNPVVAKVENKEIHLVDLVTNTYSNPQIGQFLSQGGTNIDALLTVFRKQAFDNLIEQKVAALSAKRDKVPVFGDDRQILNDMQKYVVRNFKASEDEIQKYYEANKRTLYLIPGSAVVSQVTFNTKNDAQAFSQELFASNGQDIVWLAAAKNGTVNELGKVAASSSLDPVLSKEIFEKNKMVAVGSGRLTDVVESNKKFLVGYVKDFVADGFKPLEEVRQDVSDKAIQDKKTAEGRKWIEAERKKYKVEDNLTQVLAELKKRADKADAAKKAEEAKKQAEQNKNTTPNNQSTQPKSNEKTETK